MNNKLLVKLVSNICKGFEGRSAKLQQCIHYCIVKLVSSNIHACVKKDASCAASNSKDVFSRKMIPVFNPDTFGSCQYVSNSVSFFLCYSHFQPSAAILNRNQEFNTRTCILLVLFYQRYSPKAKRLHIVVSYSS